MARPLRSIAPEKRKEYLLTNFITKHKLKNKRRKPLTPVELEGFLRRSVEELISRRAAALKVTSYFLRNLLRRLPEFKLSARQIAQRQLLRLKKQGVPIHQLTYMLQHYPRVRDKARSAFGTYWLALRSIGIEAKPMRPGRQSSLKELAMPLSKEEDTILRSRLRGASLEEIAERHDFTIPQVRTYLISAAAKVKQPSMLAWRLKRLGETEALAIPKGATVR